MKRNPIQEAPSGRELEKGEWVNKCQDKGRYGLINKPFGNDFMNANCFTNFRPTEKMY